MPPHSCDDIDAPHVAGVSEHHASAAGPNSHASISSAPVLDRGWFRRDRRARSIGAHGHDHGRWWWVLAAATACVADLGTSAWARGHLSPAHAQVLLGGLVDLRLVVNHGAAFGLWSGHETLVEVAEIGALVALALLGARSRVPLVGAGLGAAFGGGLANLAVRVLGPGGPRHAPVVDWIHVSFYPETFNLADVAIRLGIVMAVAGTVLTWRRQGRGVAAHGADGTQGDVRRS